MATSGDFRGKSEISVFRAATGPAYATVSVFSHLRRMTGLMTRLDIKSLAEYVLRQSMRIEMIGHPIMPVEKKKRYQINEVTVYL